MIPPMGKKGILLILLSACGYGIMPVMARIAYDNGADIYELLFLRFTIALLLFTSYLIICGKIRKILLISGDCLFRLFILGGGFFAFTSITMYQALYYLSPSLTEMIYFTYPAVVAVISVILYKEVFSLRKILSIFFMFIGVTLTVDLAETQFNLPGMIFAFASSFIYSMYIIFIKNSRIQKLDAMIISFYVMVFADFTFLLLGFFNGSFQFEVTARGYFAVSIIALFSTVIALISFTMGSKYLTSSEIAIVASLEPLITILFDIIILKASIDFKTSVGLGLILLSVVILSYNSVIQRKV